jgi:HEPN domain-containing protein
MNKTDIIYEWLEHSKNDYIAAKHLFEDLWPKQISISAYHCQQCVEKALKAYLVDNDVDPPYTHDLDILRAMCSEINVDFDNYKESCIDLTEYATHTRYPGGFDIPEADAKSAIEKALSIYEFIIGLIPDIDKRLYIGGNSKQMVLEL